jgi:polysaccharide biosynthesis protein PslH
LYSQLLERMPASMQEPPGSGRSQPVSKATRPSLVFAACQPPYPLDRGARIRTHHLLTGLARAFETVFVTFEDHPDSANGPCGTRELERLYPDVDVITVPGSALAKRAGQALSLLGRRSWTNGRYQSRAFTEAVRGAVASTRSRIVHFDDLGVAQVGPLATAFSVYSSHNIEERILRHGAHTGSAPRRLFYGVEARKVGAEERRVWRSMDLSLAVSPLDAEAMKAGGASRVELCPNGAPPVARMPVTRRSAEEPMRLLFVGTGSYVPYERGLAWFVREVMPRIQSRTSVALDVVGDPPARPIQAKGVRYVGNVPSVEPFYSASHGVIVPVFEGSGTRLKILEAMAYGRPVISTRLGAEGLPVEPGQHFFQADDAEGFTGAALGLAGWSLGPEDAGFERLIASARDVAEAFFWPDIARRLVDLYRSELDRLENPATPDPADRTANSSPRPAGAGHRS